MTIKTATAIRHVAFEDLGVFEAVLSARGVAVDYVEAGIDDLNAVAAASPDLLIVLGGPIGAYEDALYPFLADEIALIERRLRSGLPLIGICLGAQLMARAAGARVYPGTQKEIAFAPLTLTPDGESSCLRELQPAGNVVLNWHGDTFDLPHGAKRLCSTPITPNQAFSLGPNALGLQFHMEVDPRRIETWLIGHTMEIAHAGLDVRVLRAQAERLGHGIAAAGAAAFCVWLDGLVPGN